MKQFYIFKLLCLLCILNLGAQTTFDWENATDNGTTISQTVNGVTASFTVSSNDPQLINSAGFGGTSEFFVASELPSDINATFTFSMPINITSIYALEGLGSNNTDELWTFVPTGGANSNVSELIPAYNNGGVNVVLNWTDITQITVTSSGSAVFFAFDNIESDFELSNPEFDNPLAIKLFPNPSSDFISISDMTSKEDYKIFNYLGAEILKGTINNNEKIDIKNFSNGLYFLKFENGSTLKFLKK